MKTPWVKAEDYSNQAEYEAACVNATPREYVLSQPDVKSFDSVCDYVQARHNYDRRGDIFVADIETAFYFVLVIALIIAVLYGGWKLFLKMLRQVVDVIRK